MADCAAPNTVGGRADSKSIRVGPGSDAVARNRSDIEALNKPWEATLTFSLANSQAVATKVSMMGSAKCIASLCDLNSISLRKTDVPGVEELVVLTTALEAAKTAKTLLKEKQATQVEFSFPYAIVKRLK